MNKITAFFKQVGKVIKPILKSMDYNIDYSIAKKEGKCIITGKNDTNFISLNGSIILKIFKFIPIKINLGEIMIGQNTVNSMLERIKQI